MSNTITSSQVAAYMSKIGKPLPGKVKGKRVGIYRSKLEEEFAGRLEWKKKFGEVESWAYEAVKLKIGNGAFFKPDFFVVSGFRVVNKTLRFYETKGPFAREASIVRIKAAAMLYPFFEFWLVTKENGEWIERRV